MQCRWAILYHDKQRHRPCGWSRWPLTSRYIIWWSRKASMVWYGLVWYGIATLTSRYIIRWSEEARGQTGSPPDFVYPNHFWRGGKANRLIRWSLLLPFESHPWSSAHRSGPGMVGNPHDHLIKCQEMWWSNAVSKFQFQSYCVQFWPVPGVLQFQ